MASAVRERFADLVRSPSGACSLAEAALLIAAEEKPGLDVDRYLAQLKALADEVRPRIEGGGSARERIESLNRFLYAEKRFSGSRNSYHDIRNSFLDDVLDRRTGLPITLAIVYIEVAAGVGLDVRGVSFPAHFLCKHTGQDEIIIDPFAGRILTFEDCEAKLRVALGRGAVLEPERLRTAEPREILARLLRNLKHVHLRASRFEKALACCDRILLVTPDVPREFRDRGVLYRELECFRAALGDFERFLELAPHDPSADAIRRGLAELRRQAAQIH